MIALLALGLAGCAPTGTDEHGGAESQSNGGASVQEHDEAWAQALRQAPSLEGREKPDVAVIRPIAPTEFGEIMVGCLADAGFPDAQLTEDGEGYSIFTPAGAAGEALVLAEYTCRGQYPLDEAYSAPFTSAQLDMIYDHFSGPLRACLAQAGYEIGEPPTREAFVEHYGTSASWDPFDADGLRVEDLSGAQYLELTRACPPMPDGLYD